MTQQAAEATSPGATPTLDFDSRHLRILRTVIETGSITGAARRLYVSQPAVTASVQKLEAALGVTLLERHARGVTPTAAGQRLLKHARRVDEALSELVDDVGASAGPLAALALGASTTIAAGLAPRLFSLFADAHQVAGMRLRVGNTAAILDEVKQGTLPMGLVEGLTRAPRVHLEPFLDDTILPVVAASSPLRGAAALESPILWRERGSGTRAVVERALRSRGRKPTPQDLELGSTDAIRAATIHGLGVAFLSRWSIGPELETGRLRVLSIPGLDIVRSFSWVMPSRHLTGTSALFHEFAVARRGELHP